MKLIANGLNREFFRSCLPPPGKEIDGVVAAIAYGDDKTMLLEYCIKNHHQLDIWMRYDHTVPVSPAFYQNFSLTLKIIFFVNLYQIACTAKLFGGRDMALILVQPI